MNINKIIQRVNLKLAGELLEYHEAEPFLDDVIDDINALLNTRYPAFSEFNMDTFPNEYPNYEFFPEKYIRMVLIPGAAYKFYAMDDDGSEVAPAFALDYEQGKFLMTRDYLDEVPHVWKIHGPSQIGVPHASVKLHENGYGRGNDKWTKPNIVDFHGLDD